MDFPGVLVTCQLAQIRLFDFEVKHIKGITHTAANRLSRRPPQDNNSTKDKENIDDLIALELKCVRIARISIKKLKTIREFTQKLVIIIRSHVRFILLPEFPGRKWGISFIRGVNNPPELSINHVTIKLINNNYTDNIILPLNNNYSSYSQDITQYLITLKQPK